MTTDPNYPILFSLFASEVSYTANQQRLEALQAMSGRTPEQEAELAALSGFQDRDWEVMDHWISLLHEAGVEFCTDPAVQALRPVVMQELLDQDEYKRQELYNGMVNQADPEQVKNLLAQDQELQDHEALINQVLAGGCLWLQ